MRRVLLVGLALFAGAVVTAFFWPAWYDMAPLIPLSDRLVRAATAVAPGIVVTALGLQLLAGLPLVSWFATWADNLTTAGRSKSPVAAWREIQDAEEATRRWRAGRSVQVSADAVHGLGQDEPERRAYANVRQEHREHGDEDAPVYGARTPASDEDEATPTARGRSRARLNALAALDLVRAGLAVTPASNAARREWLLAEQARLLAIVVQFARSGPGDGRRLGDDATRELLRGIIGPDIPR